ncbi:LysM domain-containing protein [Aeromicrobium endophyticum]|uniref:LysM domain-containing protein n=2 Tax=Aeromicrobium endophyticum TaxID=2292704 RepID=A0A371P1N6_9ACTN|nr:LysM domain-containing protein [Aeromicrobium endophyticum]
MRRPCDARQTHLKYVLQRRGFGRRDRNSVRSMLPFVGPGPYCRTCVRSNACSHHRMTSRTAIGRARQASRLTSPTEAIMSTITLGNVRTSQRVSMPSVSAPMKLTVRGKIVIVTLAVLAIGILAIMWGPSSTASGEAGTPQQTTSVQVMPGHTLWQIAADANPHGDIRKTVDEIIELNSLPNASALQMGSEIAVPVYDK